MNQNPDTPAVRFYKTPPVTCPYLPHRTEQLVFTYLTGTNADTTHSLLAHAGFRRSHGIAYRPDCENCAKCVPIRVRVKDFKPNRSHKRIIQRNAELSCFLQPTIATQEQFELFQSYQAARHSDGKMASMNFEEYTAMIEDTPVRSMVLEYREANGELFAAALTDQLKDGLSMVYSFFQPGAERRSPGIWIILEHIERARKQHHSHIYLGYWIQDCAKMSYKNQFQPVEALATGSWQNMVPDPR